MASPVPFTRYYTPTREGYVNPFASFWSEFLRLRTPAMNTIVQQRLADMQPQDYTEAIAELEAKKAAYMEGVEKAARDTLHKNADRRQRGYRALSTSYGRSSRSGKGGGDPLSEREGQMYASFQLENREALREIDDYVKKIQAMEEEIRNETDPAQVEALKADLTDMADLMKDAVATHLDTFSDIGREDRGERALTPANKALASASFAEGLRQIGEDNPATFGEDPDRFARMLKEAYVDAKSFGPASEEWDQADLYSPFTGSTGDRVSSGSTMRGSIGGREGQAGAGGELDLPVPSINQTILDSYDKAIGDLRSKQGRPRREVHPFARLEPTPWEQPPPPPTSVAPPEPSVSTRFPAAGQDLNAASAGGYGTGPAAPPPPEPEVEEELVKPPVPTETFNNPQVNVPPAGRVVPEYLYDLAGDTPREASPGSYYDPASRFKEYQARRATNIPLLESGELLNMPFLDQEGYKERRGRMHRGEPEPGYGQGYTSDFIRKVTETSPQYGLAQLLDQRPGSLRNPTPSPGQAPAPEPAPTQAAGPQAAPPGSQMFGGAFSQASGVPPTPAPAPGAPQSAEDIDWAALTAPAGAAGMAMPFLGTGPMPGSQTAATDPSLRTVPDMTVPDMTAPGVTQPGLTHPGVPRETTRTAPGAELTMEGRTDGGLRTDRMTGQTLSPPSQASQNVRQPIPFAETEMTHPGGPGRMAAFNDVTQPVGDATQPGHMSGLVEMQYEPTMSGDATAPGGSMYVEAPTSPMDGPTPWQPDAPTQAGGPGARAGQLADLPTDPGGPAYQQKIDDFMARAAPTDIGGPGQAAKASGRLAKGLGRAMGAAEVGIPLIGLAERAWLRQADPVEQAIDFAMAQGRPVTLPELQEAGINAEGLITDPDAVRTLYETGAVDFAISEQDKFTAEAQGYSTETAPHQYVNAPPPDPYADLLASPSTGGTQPWMTASANYPDIPNIPGAGQVANLQRLDELIVGPEGAAGDVNSAYRSPALNEAVGGVEGSAHLEGRAADLPVPPGMTNVQYAEYLLANYPVDKVMVYPDKPHVHVSVAPEGMAPRKQRVGF